ncbi:MAG: hypothetical protein MUO63_05905 [Desulfobulbaceae bacterium]|nr:hypothetical protein [Desulfobulbaceae bacterium]
MDTSAAKKTLIICYSLSGQTSNLLETDKWSGIHRRIGNHRKAAPGKASALFVRINPDNTVIMMMLTFFRKRIPIVPLSDKCKGRFDLMILAGPTWSYHPSGPVLSLLDRDGSTLFANQTVISLISCRGYWRMHWFGLRALLKKNSWKRPAASAQCSARP